MAVTVSKQAEKATLGARDPIMMILAEVAGLPVTQLRLEVRRQETVSLLAGLQVKIGRIEGIERIELTFHWYMGIVPPFDGVAVKVTDAPGQKGLADVVMVIPAGRLVFTTMETVSDRAGFPEVQVSEEESEQETRSPLAGK